jgi:hypothetical protein
MNQSYESQILTALDSLGGWTSGQVARLCRPQSGNRSQHTARIRQILLKLQTEGKVQTLDDQKPVCWIIAKDTNDNP